MSFLSILSTEAASHRELLRQQILTLTANRPDRESFESLALAVFRYQAQHNTIYADYLRYLHVQPDTVTAVRAIPFMPISFFKNHIILTGIATPAAAAGTNVLTFASSGTTNQRTTSRHIVPDPDLYDTISRQIFEQTYGPLRNFHILALLPSYLERNNSSLVYMVQQFMACIERWQGEESQSGFFLHNHHELTQRLHQLAARKDQKKVLLIGVTFGLLDWVESGTDLSFLGEMDNLIVMETGGMKGRRKELLREEVHELLIGQLGIRTVHSEYGMTELLSQAYSTGAGVFQPSSTLRVYLRDINDPFYLFPDESTRVGERRTGGINVIDLGNLDSCSFIETQDLGQFVDIAHQPGSFQVIGRFDNSDVRGCNLLV